MYWEAKISKKYILLSIMIVFTVFLFSLFVCFHVFSFFWFFHIFGGVATPCEWGTFEWAPSPYKWKYTYTINSMSRNRYKRYDLSSNPSNFFRSSGWSHHDSGSWECTRLPQIIVQLPWDHVTARKETSLTRRRSERVRRVAYLNISTYNHVHTTTCKTHL